MLTEESHISNFSTEKQDDGDIRCPNCYWYFSITTKPYILPCFHNLCDKCINNLIQQNNPKCPVCSNIFTHEGKNPFQVNFGFLNLVTKILTNKIIFCKKCYKIYYWNDHYTSCTQEDFIETDEIMNDIKESCENGIKILNIINKKNNNNFSILNQYKNEIMTLLTKFINKIRKKNLNKIKNELEKLFTINNKEKSEFNFEDIKNNIINYLLICSNYPEYFDINEIKKTIESFTPCLIKNNQSMNKKIYIKNQINKNFYEKSTKSTNNTRQKKEILKKGNNNTALLANKINKMRLKKTPPKNQIFSDNKSNVLNNDKTRYLKQNEDKVNLIKVTKNMCISAKKEKNQNEEENESEEDLIINNDDYHEMKDNKIEDKNNKKNNNNKDINDNNNNDNRNESGKKFDNINYDLERSSKKNKIINIQDIFEKSIYQESKTEKKIIVGLNEIKVISLKKKVNNNNNSNNQKIIKSDGSQKPKEDNISDKNFIKTNNNTQRKNYITSFSSDKNLVPNTENNKLKNTNKNLTQHKKDSFPSPNILLSPNITKSSKHLFIPKNKNIVKLLSPNTKSNKNQYNININNLKINNRKPKINLYLIDSNKKNPLLNSMDKNEKKPFVNITNINNINLNTEFFGDKKKNKYVNYFSNPNNNNNNKSMSKILQNFNNTKDIINNVKKYMNSIEYINNTINNHVDKNILLLKENIVEDYNFLLNDVANNYFSLQRNFLFSFKNNTKSIVLFNIEYNTFIPMDLSSILTNFPNFNSSIQFELAENSDCYLLFITGGNERIIKDNNNYSSDSFLIINIKLNIFMNSKNKIDFTQKYIIEYKDKMPLKKSHHSILFYDDNLYVIGGFDDHKKATKECFYFSYKNKSWKKMPNLNIPRANCSICLYNKSFLYLFRGRNNEGELNTIEYININNIENNNWKLINVIDYGLVWNNIYNSCTVSYEENKILIFGGEDENKLYRESFLFDIKNNNIYRGMDLKIPAAFNGKGIYNNGKIYGFDFKNKNGDYEHKLHIFDIQKNFWTIISY